MKNLKRALTTLALTVGLAVATIGAAPSAQAAFPSNCGSSVSGATLFGTAVAWCNSGTGQIRAVAGCKNIFGYWTNPVGKWVDIKSGSARVSCPFGYPIQWAGFHVKG